MPIAEAKQVILYPKKGSFIAAREEIKSYSGTIVRNFKDEVFRVNFPDAMDETTLNDLKWSSIVTPAALTPSALTFLMTKDGKSVNQILYL